MFVKHNKKGFTLIELIVVIAVMGLLVLLAAPKFLGHTADAKFAQIKADTKTIETIVSAELTNNEDLLNDWGTIPQAELDKMNSSNKVVNKRGEIVVNLDGENYIIDKGGLNLKTNLKGDFILTSSEQVVYYDKNLVHIQDPDDSLSGGNSSDESISEGNSEDGSAQVQLEFTPDTHFTWTENSSGYDAVGQDKKGYYKYTGTGEETVVIPHEINGTPITSYLLMFSGGGADVKKVVSTNPNVTNMNFAFADSLAKELDLSEFDTSGVDRMQTMFSGSKATKLNLANWDTSNVLNMISMFQNSNATELNLSSFSTPKVADMSNMFNGAAATTIILGDFSNNTATNMRYMFQNVKATNIDFSNFYTPAATNMSNMFNGSQMTTLDLSNFDISKVTSTTGLNSMFQNSKATTGYAKTNTEATRFNATSNKPTGLTFVAK